MFLREWRHSRSQSDFLVTSVFHSRLRKEAPGDQYLFRPVMTGFLGCVEVLAGGRLDLVACAGIGLHAALCLAMFLFLRSATGSWLPPFCAALYLATCLPGMEMVAWSHIYPYILSFICMIAALHLLVGEAEVGWRRATAIATFNLVAVLTHEFHVPFQTFLAAVLFMSSRRDPRLVPAWVSFAVPPVLWCLGNGAEYLWHGSLASPPSTPVVEGDASLLNALRLPGLALSLVVFPFQFRPDPGSVMGRMSWSFAGSPPWALAAFGAATLAGASALLFHACRRIMRRDRRTASADGGFREDIALATACLGWLIFSLGVGLGRLVPRGDGYLYNSTYYYYLAWVFACLSGPVLYRRLRNAAVPPAWRGAADVSTAAAVVALCCGSHVAIQGVLSPSLVERRRIAEETGRVFAYFQANPGLRCAGGLGNGGVVVAAWFGRFAGPRRDCPPVYVRRDGGQLEFLRSAAAETWGGRLAVDLDVEGAGWVRTPDGRLHAGRPDTNPLGDGCVVLSRRPFDCRMIRATIHAPFDGGIVLRHGGGDSFRLLVMRPERMYIHAVDRGLLSGMMHVTPVDPVPPRGERLVELDLLAPDLVVLLDGQVAAVIPGFGPVSGRVGFFDAQSGPSRQGFSGLQVVLLRTGEPGP